MKTIQLFTTLLAFTTLSTVTMAAQVSVEDITNQPPVCYDGPDKYLKADGCSTVPKGTLQVTVKLDENEQLEMLDNIHVVIENKGQFFQYGTMGGATWEPVSIKGLMTSVPLKSSYGRFPPNSPHRISGREVYLGEFYTKGTKVYVGVRANDTAGFLEGSVKEAFIVK